MLSRTARPLLTALLCLIAHSAVAQLRVVSWNTDGGPRDGTAAVLRAVGEEEVNGFARPADILSLQGQDAAGDLAMQAVLDELYGPGVYAAADAPSEGALSLFYNTQSLELLEATAIGEVGQGVETIRYKVQPLDYREDAAFYVYDSLLSPHNDNGGRNARLLRAEEIRYDLESLGAFTAAVLTGGFNTFGSSEPALGALLSTTAPGDSDDPDALVTLSRPSAGMSFHSQTTSSPTTSPFYPGQGASGMTQAFDYQLLSADLTDGFGVDYIEGSYRVFGNNGTHGHADGITTGSGAAPDVLDALQRASDHLPVVTDLQIPAVLHAEAVAPLRQIVPIYTEAQVGLRVRNDADVQAEAGADQLIYQVSVFGSIPSKLITGFLPGLAAPQDHVFTTNSSRPTKKTIIALARAISPASILAGSDDSYPSTLRVSFTVEYVFAGDFNNDGVVDAADYSVWRDHLGEPVGALPNDLYAADIGATIGLAQYETWRANYGRRLPDLAPSAPEPSSVALLAVCLVSARAARSRRQVTWRLLPAER